jgi:N-acetylglucosamine-6-phosphate deacetylase
VHDRTHIRSVNHEDEAVYQSLLPIPTIVTLAPELVPAETVNRLSRQGIHISAGHTNATFAQMSDAVRAGLTGVTHLHNAMSALASREPGVVGAALAEQTLKAGIIVDGYHVHFATVKASWNAKKRGDLFLVTDAMPPVGGGPDSFRIGEHEIFYRDGRCQTREGVLGGSAIDLASAIRNAIQKVGIPKDEALRMATLYPARFLKVEHDYGQLREGCVANLVVFNNEIVVSKVMFKGRFLGDLHREEVERLASK